MIEPAPSYTGRVFLCSGHMTDLPGRAEPRFPAVKEEAVRARIARQLDDWGMEKGDLALCGGARGADILFAELAHARGATVHLLLPFDEENFIERSVRVPQTDWEKRFRRLARFSEIQVQEMASGRQDPEDNPYSRNNRRLLKTARDQARNTENIFIVLVWDERSTGDGPGGTSDMASRRNEFGQDHVAIINPASVEAFARDRHFANDGKPKRILCLDGGGVRGILTLQYLKRIESILQTRYGNRDLVLADYFDLIAGTSTGGIIAAALAIGMAAGDIEQKYNELAGKVFKRKWYRLGALRSKFDSAALVKSLQEIFGSDTTLGSPRLVTGLLIVTKRMDTGSPWPLSNNPRATYFHQRPGSTSVANASYLLWKIVRASTAAPSYFAPERIQIDPNRPGDFVDGGVSTANNPSLEALKLARLENFGLCWPAGSQQLMLVSCGTGRADPSTKVSRIAGKHAVNSLLSIMVDCGDLIETIMQWLSTPPTARSIDGDIGDLGADLLSDQPLLTYRRYNVLLENKWLKKELSREFDAKTLKMLGGLDRPDAMPLLAELGAASAQQHLPEQHLPVGFDI